MSKTLHQKLANIQQKLKAPKNQFNKFGNYPYRNQEDILEAVKPLLGDLTLIIEDDIKEIGGRVYVQAKATLSDGEHSVSNSAYAREEESKKGMDSAQLTGATSSYARKYALNGLFLIDDTRDADAINTHGKEDKPAPEKPKVAAVVDQKAPESFKRKPKAVSAAKPSEDTEDDY
jgi:hypothetical protein